MAATTNGESRFVFSATQANFQQLVVENSRKGPVLVDFWAPWAGPSLRQGELLKRLAAEYGGRFLLVSVDTDKEKGIAQELGVKSLPSCRLFRYGRVVEQLHGMQTEADYRALIDRYCANLADRDGNPRSRDRRQRRIRTPWPARSRLCGMNNRPPQPRRCDRSQP